MAAATEDHAAHRAHVRIVESPPQRDVTRGGQQVVCRIDVDPSAAGTVDGQPRMRRIAADQFRAAWRRDGLDVAADVARGEAHEAQARDAQTREVLTHSAPQPQHVAQRGRDRRRVRVEREIRVNAAGEIQNAFEQRASGRERRPCIADEFVGNRPGRGFEEAFDGLERKSIEIPTGLPRRRIRRLRHKSRLRHDVTLRAHRQLSMSALHDEERHRIAEVIQMGPPRRRLRIDVHGVLDALLVRQRPRRHARDMVRHRHRFPVCVLRRVHDVVGDRGVS